MNHTILRSSSTHFEVANGYETGNGGQSNTDDVQLAQYNAGVGKQNDQVLYGGTNWETITFVNGMYSYTDLEDYIQEYIRKQGPATGTREVGQNIWDQHDFVLSSYKVVIELGNNYQLDFRGSRFGEFIGFEPKLITQTEYGNKLPNNTNSTDVINVNCDAITDSLVAGQNSNTITVIPTDNLTRSFPFLYEPTFLSFSPVPSTTISQIRFSLTDAIGRPINLNGIDWYLDIFLRSTPFT